MVISQLMSAVASASDTNLMDAHNLAIVLAPNLLPSAQSSSSKKSSWFTEDNLLSSTISVIEVRLNVIVFDNVIY